MFKHPGLKSLIGIFVVAALFLIIWHPMFVSAQVLELTKALTCLDVKERLPIGEAQQFPSSVKRVFCYTIIEGSKAPTHVTHVWSYKGKRVREITLPVNSIRWRTWSYKNIYPGEVGPWKVDIIDTTSQKVMGTVQFSIY